MSVLDSIISLRRMEDERELRDISQVSTAVDSYINAQDAASKIKARTPSALEELITRGKAADAAKTLGDRGLYESIVNLKTPKGPVDTINKSLDPIAQVSERTATSIDDFLNTEKEDALLAELSTQVDSFTGKPTGEAILAKNKLDAKSKKDEAIAKGEAEAESLEPQIKDLIDSFQVARQEASSVNNIGKAGLKGRIAGQEAVISGKLGNLPSVNTYQRRLKAFSTRVAKTAGEQRPTDEDIKRFMGTLPSITLSDEENSQLIDGLMSDLKSRGAKVVWAERTRGELNKTLKEKKLSFKSEEEAKNADLPSGTVIYINGKKAKVR